MEPIEIEFETITESWNEYLLKDGTKIKFKFVPIAILKTDKFDQEGNPVYQTKPHFVSRIIPPQGIKNIEVRLIEKHG